MNFNFHGFPAGFFQQGFAENPDFEDHEDDPEKEKEPSNQDEHEGEDDFEDLEDEEEEKQGEIDENKDLYEILGVEKTATDAEIKKAFKKKARKLHPDKGGDPEKFRELNEAYEILSDPERREIYDKSGMAGLREEDMFEGDEFGGIFGNFFGNKSKKGNKTQKLKPILKELSVTLDDAYLGNHLKYKNKRSVICSKCDGKGGENAKPCSTCKGKGMIEKMMMLGPGMYQHMTSPCSDCAGAGNILDEKDFCEQCQGKKMVDVEKELEVVLERGVPQEHDYQFESEGQEEPGYLPGDLYLRVLIQNHPIFRRVGADLYIDKEITLSEALCGLEFEVCLLNGETIRIMTKNDDVIIPGEMKVIKGKGMPFFKDPEKFGNLYVHFKVIFPKPFELEKGQLELLSKILPSEPSEDIIKADGATIELGEFFENEVNTNPEGGKASEEEQEYDEMTHGQKIQCGTQ